MSIEELQWEVVELRKRMRRMESFLLFLGDLCDHPDSLRSHLAEACEAIYSDRLEIEQDSYVGRWKKFR